MPVQHRYISFDAGNGLSVTCLRGEEPPTVTDGYGGWTVVDRPRRVGYTSFTGVSPIRMKVPCLFDNWWNGENIEAQINNLARMALPPVDGTGHPPIIDVGGALPRQDISRWVIESLEWGTNVIWVMEESGVGKRIRQDVVVNLLQYVEPQAIPYKGRISSGRPKPKFKFYRVRRGDTLRKISAKAYGNQKWWRDIQKANHISDPKKLKVGRRLRMP